MNKKIWQRFEELENEIKNIESTKYFNEDESEYELIKIDTYIKWKVKVGDIFSNLVNEKSEYYKEFIKITTSIHNYIDFRDFQQIKSIFLALKSDYHKGYLTSIKTLVQAEVFETQLEQAKELLDSSYTLASAVIAGVVLETAIREICTSEEITHGKLDKMNADLAKKGIYNKLQQKQITALADIRNSAAHGKDNEFSKEDVEKMIRDIEDFLAKYLNDV